LIVINFSLIESYFVIIPSKLFSIQNEKRKSKLPEMEGRRRFVVESNFRSEKGRFIIEITLQSICQTIHPVLES